MNKQDGSFEKIREALDREAARRFDADRCARSLAEASSEGAHHPEIARHDRREGPFGRLPVPLQWAGLAAALLGAALGIRSFYLETTAGRSPSVEAGNAGQLAAPPGADAAIPVPGSASAPPLSPQPDPPAPERRKRQQSVPQDPEEVFVAEAAPSEEPLGTPEPDPPESDPAASTSAGVLVGTATPGSKGEGTGPTAEVPLAMGGTLPLVVRGPLAAEVDSPGPGVRVLSASVGGRQVRPVLRLAPEVGATFVLLPALARFSSARGSARASDSAAVSSVPPAASRPSAATSSNDPAGMSLTTDATRRLAEIDPSLVDWVRASTEASSRVLGPRDEEIPDDDPGSDVVETPREAAGAYFVRFFLGSRFDPIPERSQGLMGDGLQVVPLRESEVWGDSDQEQYLARTFHLDSVIAVDGARIEPDSEDGKAESSFIVGVAGNLFRVTTEGSPAEDPGEHRVELRVQRADTRPGETGDGTTILEATLIVENGRIVVFGIPESDSVGGGGRGPRVAFIALSPRFDQFARPAQSEPVFVVEGEVDPPVLVEKVEPEYSREARERRAEGKVVLQAVIRADGTVDGIQVLRVPQVSGGDFLVEAASKAVRQWRYLPAQLRGEPVNVYFTVVVNFQLSPEGDL